MNVYLYCNFKILNFQNMGQVGQPGLNRNELQTYSDRVNRYEFYSNHRILNPILKNMGQLMLIHRT